ncbi:DUF305 domain-containing protein [Deinococcus koreensis]|uniref:DUF305 domain-containing protein n=1 Tax=Deinococcus koreensis TaxID=2054903 RepID=A0A2K3UV72_9DEIO|nr:DUF305 domain-containing protein [Deinococcus koreensis]PNY80439.1 DUF305 domain-containing protein [Deinococcus koreensis]
MNRRVRTPAALLLLALVGLAALFFLLPGRTAPAESSREVRFVREMTQHHVQAIDMATRLRDRTRDRTLRSLALDIILSQQEQIGQMRGWLTLWGRPWGGAGMDAAHARAMGMATPAEVQSLDTLSVPQAEVRFLQLMRRHHQGALAMVQPVLSGPLRPEVRALARQIAASQGAEIRLMDSLLKERGATPLPAPGQDMDGMDMGGAGEKHDH